MTRIAYALISLVLVTGCSPKGESPVVNSEAGSKPPDAQSSGFKKLVTEDLEPGKGPAAQKGDVVLVFYVGKFKNGTIFDSNMNDAFVPDPTKQPYPVTIGTGGVIKGWDQGLVGTKEGMVRKISVPYALAYGDVGDPPKIPAKSDMIFTVKIAKLYKAGVAPEIIYEDVKVGTGPKATLDSTIKFHYKGMLLSGKVFDDQVKDLEMTVSKLIPGFKECVVGMQAGGQRKISWPPGSPNPTGQIPPGQPIEFIIDVTSVK